MSAGKPFYNNYVQVNDYSRPNIPLVAHKGIITHYTANAGVGADSHRRFFDGSDGGGGRHASAHIFVDRKEAICIVPLDEVAYHANDRGGTKIREFEAEYQGYDGGANLTTVGVEMCLESDGSIHPDTVSRTEEIVKYLMRYYDVSDKYVLRHYDVTGKNCPAPFVSDPQKWKDFKSNISGETKSEGDNKAFHVVEKGDTLWAISREYGVSVGKIKEYNGLDDDVLTIGDKLILSDSVYVVQKGDSLWAIAQEYDVTVDEIKELNSLESDTISIGQKLVVDTERLDKDNKSGGKVSGASTGVEIPDRFLEKGDSGSAVRKMQEALVEANFYPNKSRSNNGVDGYFGDNTEDALKRFQSVYTPREVDGLFGPKTRKALDKKVN